MVKFNDILNIITMIMGCIAFGLGIFMDDFELKLVGVIAIGFVTTWIKLDGWRE